MLAEQTKDATLVFARFWKPVLFALLQNLFNFLRCLPFSLHTDDGKDAFRNIDLYQIAFFHMSDRSSGLRLRAAMPDDRAWRSTS